MAPKIVEEAEELWETWNIRICILLSFLIQLFLTLLAPWRKRHYKMSFVIWILYLLADAVALYTIGLISNSSLKTNTNHILVFWSPFLLVHLGGPDTITALALEDNELWLRHFLQLATQSAGTFYLFYRAYRTKSGIELLIPAIIMYVNGCVKYLERTSSLYLASMDTYRESLSGKPNAGPNYAALMEEFSSRKASHIPVYIKPNWEAGQSSTLQSTTNNNSSDCWTTKEMDLVKQAYHFYLKFRGLIAERMFSSIERTESRDYFLKVEDGKQAFKVIQIELNFIYDVFYTKVNTLLKARGITRAFTFITVIAAYLLFYFNKYTHNYRLLDLCITHVLLVGGIFMELLAFVMFCFSDWAVVGVVEIAKRWKCNAPFINCLLDVWLRHRPRRWSQQISQYDLLYRCLNDHSTLMKAMLLKRMKDVVANLLYTAAYEFDDELGKAIFNELLCKAKIADKPEDAKKACEARGDLVFFSSEFNKFSNQLRDWTLEVDYDESLLLWHIATNLCFQEDDEKPANSKPYFKHRRHSKMLGDYMMYLLMMKPSMTSSVAGIAQVRFQDTCEEAKMFIRRKLPGDKKTGKLYKAKQFFILLGRFFLWLLSVLWSKVCGCCCYYCCKKKDTEDEESNELSLLFDGRLRRLCRKIRGTNTDQKPEEVKGDRSKSVLFDACRLAKELMKIGTENGKEKQWEVIFKVWVELLCYSASRSKPNAHVAQLREGGELITLVWLLMAHLGLGEQFRINKGTGWAKLIVPK